MAIKQAAKKNKISITLKIENCLDCPHHKTLPDPGADSFDAMDEQVVCTLTKALPDAYPNPYGEGFRPILRAERWNIREQCSVPDWCPLIKKK